MMGGVPPGFKLVPVDSKGPICPLCQGTRHIVTVFSGGAQSDPSKPPGPGFVMEIRGIKVSDCPTCHDKPKVEVKIPGVDTSKDFSNAPDGD